MKGPPIDSVVDDEGITGEVVRSVRREIDDYWRDLVRYARPLKRRLFEDPLLIHPDAQEVDG